MNKNILILFFIIILSISTFSEELSKYSFIKLKTIPIGKEKGMIGWQQTIAGGPSGPMTFVINDKGIFYIPDIINERLNIYDNNLNLIRNLLIRLLRYH